MARVGRLAGAILAETRDEYFLVGLTKEPCDWAAAGFHVPGGLDEPQQPFIRLTASRPVELPAPRLRLAVEGEELARLLARRLVIARNGSVSERLWRLVIGTEEAGAADVEIEARWFDEIPEAVWDVVREAVLRCT
jgi:hypothetical protein